MPTSGWPGRRSNPAQASVDGLVVEQLLGGINQQALRDGGCVHLRIKSIRGTVLGRALPTMALLMALRRGASLAPVQSGALAGLGGGAAAAALYALHCPEDSPLFYVPWYGTGILMAGAAGAVLGGRLLRW